jgi:hypothetical protein
MAQTPTPSIPTLAEGSDTGRSDTDGITDVGTPTLSGTAAPGAAITLYDSDGVSALVPLGAINVTDANGFWSIPVVGVLDDGFHEITAVATLPGQTPSLHSPPLALVLDTAAPDPPTAPDLPATQDTGMALDGVTSKQVLQLTGHTEPNAIVTLYNSLAEPPPSKVVYYSASLGQTVAGADGSYILTSAALGDGSYNLVVTAADVAGNVSQPSGATAITIDSVAPAAPAAPTLSPGTDTGASRSDGLTDNDSPVVVGTTEANATVELFDGDKMVGKATADGTGAYAITADKLDDGAHALTVKAIDAAGNVSAPSAALNAVIDTTAPDATVTPTNNDLGAGRVPFAVHLSEAVGGVTPEDFALLATGTVKGSVQSVTGSGTDYVVTVAGLSGEGTVTLSLVPGAITDLAGDAAVLKEQDSHAVLGTTQPTTDEVSVTPSGLLVTGTDPSPSASGRLVAFTTFDADKLTTSPATAGMANVVVRDTLLGKTALVSLDLDGAAANGVSGGASISADGTEIAFVSEATNLVDTPTEAGEANVYVAKLTEGADGPKVQSITLVSEGAGQQGEGALADGTEVFAAPILSADGSTVAFDSTQALAKAAESGTENVYAENVATGVITLVSGGTGKNEVGYEQVPGSGTELVPEPDKAPGTGGDLDSDVTSVSADGKLIAYESNATDLGGAPVQVIGGDFVPYRGYVYNTAAGATTTIDGNALPQADANPDYSPYHNTYDPVLSGDGSTALFGVHYVTEAGDQAQSLYEYSLATGVTTPVSLGNDVGSFQGNSIDASASKGGGLVLYQSQVTAQGTLDNPVTGTMTTLLPGFGEVLTSAGNAYAYSEQPDGDGSNQLYETNLGVSAGVDPIDGDDALDASALAKAAAGGGLAVNGTTNAPAGATVAVQLFGASADTNTLNSPVGLGTADGLGHWTATVPTALLQSADGNYALVVQVGLPTGNSFFSLRDFIVDTKAPDAPDAPKLDAGSDTSLASDGSATSQDMPIFTGTAEAGATVTLYDSLSATPDSPAGTATADADGLYAVSPTAALINGKHELTVTATDAAGNVSAMSDPLTVTVDTIAPDAPNAPMLKAASDALPPFAGSSFDQPAPPAGSDTGRSDSDAITMNASPTLTGTAEPNSTVTLYDTDDISVLGTATANAKGAWEVTPGNALAEGAHTLTVTATDAAGNVSPHSAGLAVVIDTLPPLAPAITSVAGDVVNGNELGPIVDVTGMAEPDSIVTLTLDGAMGGVGADFGEATASDDGSFTVESLSIPAGQHKLQVTATDVAGNVSQPSLPVYETIADLAKVQPIGSNLGNLQDGYIDGATVFADANGNGVEDAAEAVAITDTDGQFALSGGSGELVATGGTDTTTGLSLPGALTAPAGSTTIDPLTTLLDAFVKQTGDSVAAANAAVTAAFGLGATNLTTLDPDAAALSGSPSLDPAVADGAAAVADAKLADLAVGITAALSDQPGETASPSAIFAEVFTAVAAEIATLAPGETIGLENPGAIVAATAAASGGADGQVELAAGQIAGAGMMQLDADAGDEHGQALLDGITQVETFEQGAAATALAEIGADPGLGATLVPKYTGAALATAASVTAALITDAPRLARGSDQGSSATDNFTDDLAPTFVGTALPGTFVTLLEFVYPTNGGDYSQGQVLGTAQADASGRYSVTVAPLTVPQLSDGSKNGFFFAAVGSATDQNLAGGSIINLPLDAYGEPQAQPQFIDFDVPGESDEAQIVDATSAASPADDAGDSALLLYVDTFAGEEDSLIIQVYADGGTTPIATGTDSDNSADSGNSYQLALTTAPLSLGPHVLTVTLTLPGGEVVTGNPSYDVTVTAPTVVDGTARAVGPIADGTVTQYDKSVEGAESRDLVRSVTGDDGAYTATVDLTRTSAPLALTDGYDTVTGLPIDSPIQQFGDDFATPDGKGGATLTAPIDYSAISPLSSITADLDGDADAVLSAFGLNPALNLATLDPLTEAQAGDPPPLLVTVELLDSVAILAASHVISVPLYQPIADFIENNDTIDLDDPADISAALAPYLDPSSALTTQQIGEVVAIVAAGNAAIDAHAAGATSLADTLSYAFAAERLEQEQVAPAVDEVWATFDGTESSDRLLPLVASYTGTALDAAIKAEVGQATQAVSLLPVGPATTSASSATFEITFSKAVMNLAPASFQLVTGSGLQDAVITGVSPVAGGAGAAYDVTVSTGIGEGTLALTYLGGGVATAAGEPITAGVIAPAATYLPVNSPSVFTSIAVGDFNGDGRPDAVLVASTNGFGDVTPYINTGGGGFQAEGAISTDAGSDNAESPIVADVNGDGKADVLVLDAGPTLAEAAAPTYGAAVTALLGDNDGTFQQPINTPLDFDPDDMVAGDFNGDGRTDIAVTDTSGNVHILLGNSAGGFTSLDSFAGGAETGDSLLASMAVGDFNGDGKLDLAVGNWTNGTVSIFLGAGDGTFTAGPVLAAGTGPDAIAVGDLNHDGIPDLAVADYGTPLGSPSVTVLLGKGDGTFEAPAPFTPDPHMTGVDALESIAIGDIDNDGTPDLVVGGNNGDVAVLLGNGDGTFRLGSVNLGASGVLRGSGLALADVDGDRRTDILAPGVNLAPDLSEDPGLDVFMNEAEAVVGSTSPSITIDRAAVAAPVLSEASGGGTFTQSGTAYTLDLGTLALGAATTATFSLANTAAAPADSFDGMFSTPSGSGFTITGASLPQPVAAGGSYAGLSFTATTGAPGTYSETITFAPRDATAIPAAAAAPDPDAGAISPVAASVTDPVAAELPAITLTVTADVAAAGEKMPPAILAAVPAITLPNVRVGAADTAVVPLTNGAAVAAANLDVTAMASGAATISGAVTGLQPGATDSTSLIAGLNTATSGALSGAVTLAPVSDAAGVTTPLPTLPVTVSGSVFRPAAAQAAPVTAILHVGDPGTVALPVANGDPADGFSESLVAAIASVTPGLTIATDGPTADIGPGATDRSLSVAVSTVAAGTVSGTATLGLTTDGGTGESSLDGLGKLALAAAMTPVTVTVDNFAQATLFATGAPLIGTAATGYTLDLGAVQVGSAPVSVKLDTVNSATGPADSLAGSYTITGGPGLSDSGFAAFSGDGAGQADAGGTVTLQTGQSGTFSQTIVLSSAGSNASGYSGALASQTVTVEGAVVPPGTPIASITTTPASVTVAEGAPATPIGITAPSDSAFTAAQLTITAGSLPTDGTVLLSDSVTPVTAGEVLTSAQLTGLLFKPAAGQFGQSSTFTYTVADPSDNVSTGTAALATGPAVGNPTIASPSLTVAENASATTIGIAAPTDPNYGASQLAIALTTLPADGSVTLADGTAVTAGQALTSTQLTGLQFTPAAGRFGVSSALGYTVTDPSGNVSAGVATLEIGSAVGNPVATPGTLTVAPGQGATALGIQAPTDPNYAAATLDATVTALPADGSIDLADDTTPITLGQVLSATQLTSLTFLPVTGASSTQSSFGYVVADPAGNASTGSFTLAIAAGTSSTGSGTATPPAAPVLTPGNLLSDFSTPSVSGTAVAGSTVTLLSNGRPVATATASATGAFTAIPASALPLGTNALTATATTSGGVSAASLPVDMFETPTQVSGSSIPDASTRDVITALGQNFGLELTGDTQAVQLLDGTISVAPGTNEGFLARLYEGLFGRAPDPATGYADDQFAMGLTRAQVATEFLATPEGQADFAGLSNGAFVSTIAQGSLGRSFSAADQSTFTSLLNNGASRGVLLEGIADSAESQAHLATATSDIFIPRPTSAGVYEMYETSLARDGDLPGVQFASNEVLQSGLSLLQVAQQIASTPEFVADHASQSNASYVNSLYQDGLGRSADQVGAALTSALNAGQITRGDALFAVASSQEAATYLTRYIM